MTRRAQAGESLPPPVLGELVQLLHEGGHDGGHRDVYHVLHVSHRLLVRQVQPAGRGERSERGRQASPEMEMEWELDFRGTERSAECGSEMCQDRA